MRRTLLSLALLSSTLCAACAHTVTGPNARCSELIPKTWREGVEGYPIPADDTLPAWQGAFVGQAGQLEKANGRTVDTIDIVSRCEALINEARGVDGAADKR
jgi:hypothetical protein